MKKANFEASGDLVVFVVVSRKILNCSSLDPKVVVVVVVGDK